MSLEILAYEPTPLGLLCLRRRQLLSKPDTMVTEVTLNHEFLMSSYLTESERALSRLGLERLRSLERSTSRELNILVGGLGLGYTAAEALKDASVAGVEVVEFLPQVIGWLRDGLIPLAEQLNAEPRLQVTQGDIYARLTGPAMVGSVPTQFDLIAIDVDHSPEDVLGDQSHGFYTEAGLRKTSQHLNANGVLAVWSYDESTPLLEKMKHVFADVSVEKVTVWNDLINEEQTDWLFFGRKIDSSCSGFSHPSIG